MASLIAPKSPFDAPLFLHTLLNQPVKSLIRCIDLFFSLLHPLPKPGHPTIRVVCISDTHCLKASHIPDGDLLVHAGDLTNAGTPSELQAQIDWLDGLPHKHKIAIAGNHDTYLDPRSRRTLSRDDQNGKVGWKSIKYLQHSTVKLTFDSGRQLRVYGAPQIPACGGEDFAVQYERGHDAWSETVPEDTEVLVTHTPPKYHLDLPAALGCEWLLKETRRVKPRLHAFGHIHAGKTEMFGWLRGGREVVRWDEGERCYERAMSGSDGLVRGLLDPRGWLGLTKVIYYGAVGLLWETVWGGETEKTTMVNASLMFCDSGKLLNAPQVVDI